MAGRRYSEKPYQSQIQLLRRRRIGKSPNSRIAIASIGVGGKGASDSDDAAAAGDMVAICDVDENTLNNAGEKRFPKAKRYTDFRKMLDEMGKSIDAVTVSTPDHNHAPAALMAMRMGKHCFCQKPLTHSIYEARLMAQVARENKRGHADGQPGHGQRLASQGGRHDQVGRAGHGEGSPRLDQSADLAARRPPPQVGLRARRTLNWDLWLGPAPARPYANGYHPFSWRGWWDFGTGALGDMACHTVNMPFMALNLRDPIAVQAETSGHNGDSYPNWSIINFEFPAIGRAGPR